MTDVIAVFDIGKTNKKLILFDSLLHAVYQEEQCFPEISDESGFPCDDIENIRKWMSDSLLNIAGKKKYTIKALNFSSYGATLAHIDDYGNLLTPIYNYLKQMPGEISESLYKKHRGIDEFSRKTASPALGFLNSGMQILWLKKTYPEIHSKTNCILHLPQYLSFIFTGKKVSELTSIGCHTALWDFDEMKYHNWLKDEHIILPEPESNNLTFKALNKTFAFPVGIGIHDSSASLAPYILQCHEKFLLISTGTWCINMNPFNHEPLSNEQLKNDCLSYLSINQKPVKSSRLFMGHIHEVNLEKIAIHFKCNKSDFKKLNYDPTLIKKLETQTHGFFKDGLSPDYVDRAVDLSQFQSFSEAYHRLMFDLTDLCINSISMVICNGSDLKNIYISGGFSKNELFVNLIARKFPGMKVFTSEFNNSSALGAALMVYKESGMGEIPEIDLGLKQW